MTVLEKGHSDSKRMFGNGPPCSHLLNLAWPLIQSLTGLTNFRCFKKDMLKYAAAALVKPFLLQNMIF